MESEIVYLGNYLGYGTGYDGNVYGGGGIAPTLKARDYKGAIKVLIENEQRESIRNDNEIRQQE